MEDYIEKTVSEVVKQLTARKLTLKTAKELSERVEKRARQIGVRATVAIVSDGANPILVHADDESYIASYDIAVNKAYTSASLKMATKELAALAKPGGSLYGIQFTNNGKIVIFGGGEALLYDGKVIGAVGVSGGSEEQDTYLASYAKEEFSKMIRGETK